MTTGTNPTTNSGEPSVDLPRGLRQRLLSWYAKHGRHDLPWRRMSDPYAILVSEVMLQQTQVSRVEPRWLRWMERWPTVRDLAAASQAEVVREWSGLGYNNRAVRLWRAANVVVGEHGGTIPGDPAALRKLPGIGSYTADAVASFSGAAAVVPVDVNVGRVLARAFHGLASGSDLTRSKLEATARKIDGRSRHRDVGLAFMDLGAMLCTARKPACERCPIAEQCAWRAAGQPPGTAQKAGTPRFEDTARFARGRIVAALGEGPLPHAELLERLPARHAARLDGYLESLAGDGLIERIGEVVRLVGDDR